MSRTTHSMRKATKRKREDRDDGSYQENKKAEKLARKVLDDGDAQNDNDPKATAPASSRLPSSAKAKERTAKKRNGNNDDDIAGSGVSKPHPLEDVDSAIGQMNSSLLADYFAQQIKRHFGDLSTLELDEKYPSAKAFLNTSEFKFPRIQISVPGFLEHFTVGGKEELRSTVDTPASPHTLFIASSGIRAADLTRALRLFQTKSGTVAKLFAKHIKLAESIEFVRKTRIGIGVGTPARLQDLIKAEALKTSKLCRIVIDGSHVDQKKRSIFTMKEVFGPLLDLLSRAEFKERYASGDLQVLVF